MECGGTSCRMVGPRCGSKVEKKMALIILARQTAASQLEVNMLFTVIVSPNVCESSVGVVGRLIQEPRDSVVDHLKLETQGA